jgi:hypothetical protein
VPILWRVDERGSRATRPRRDAIRCADAAPITGGADVSPIDSTGPQSGRTQPVDVVNGRRNVSAPTQLNAGQLNAGQLNAGQINAAPTAPGKSQRERLSPE